MASLFVSLLFAGASAYSLVPVPTSIPTSPICEYASVNLDISADPIGVGGNKVAYAGEVHGKGVHIFKVAKGGQKDTRERDMLEGEIIDWLQLTGGKDVPEIAGYAGFCERMPSAPFDGPVLIQKSGGVVALQKLIGGDFDTYLDDAKRMKLALGAAKVVAYLHGHTKLGDNGAVVWQDMSAKHLMVDDALNVKLVDVGMMWVQLRPAGHLAGSYTGAIPEKSASTYTTASNVHQLCSLIYEILTPKANRTIPTSSTIDQNTVNRQHGVTIPQKELLKKCWERNPLVRITAAEVVKALSKAQRAQGHRRGQATNRQKLSVFMKTMDDEDEYMKKGLKLKTSTKSAKRMSRTERYLANAEAMKKRLRAL